MRKLISGVVFIVLALTLTIRFGHSQPTLQKKMKFLKGAKAQLITNQTLQTTFPEGLVFITVLYGLNAADVACRVVEKETRAKYLSEAVWAVKYLENHVLKYSRFDKHLTPQYGIFYSGWKNFLLGKIVSVPNIGMLDTAIVHQFKAETAAIVSAFKSSGHLYLESYHHSVWPADNLVAMASIALHVNTIDSTYYPFVEEWMRDIKLSLLDSEGLIPHSVNYYTDMKAEGARGSSQALILTMLSEIDKTLAKRYLEIFTHNFNSSILGMQMIREYPHGIDGVGDVDSGPVILNIGASASIAGIAAYYSNGDVVNGKELERSINILRIPTNLVGNLRLRNPYVLMGESFYFWGTGYYQVD